MSVMWELDAQTLAVNKVWFGRTLIRSSYQLHYELAQALLNGEQAEVPELVGLGSKEKEVKLAQLVQALETLTRVARQLRAQRDQGGALELEGVEVRVGMFRHVCSWCVGVVFIHWFPPTGASAAGPGQKHHCAGTPAAPGGP